MINLNDLAKGGRVLKIARMGHPLLCQPSEEIDPLSSEAYQIVQDMAATLVDFGEAVGLAAPQVFIPKRVFFYGVPKVRGDEYNPEGVPLSVIFNASYEPLTEEKIPDWEACLSLPHMAGEVNRYKGVKLTYQTLEGQWKTEEAWGYKARVIQHETDHLDGILYPMQMTNLSRFGYREEVLRYRK